MADFYNEILIRNVDCGVLYFQIKNDEVKEQVLLESKALREKNMKVDNDELFKKAMKQRGISWKPPVKMEEKKSLFKRK